MMHRSATRSSTRLTTPTQLDSTSPEAARHLRPSDRLRRLQEESQRTLALRSTTTTSACGWGWRRGVRSRSQHPPPGPTVCGKRSPQTLARSYLPVAIADATPHRGRLRSVRCRNILLADPGRRLRHQEGETGSSISTMSTRSRARRTTRRSRATSRARAAAALLKISRHGRRCLAGRAQAPHQGSSRSPTNLFHLLRCVRRLDKIIEPGRQEHVGSRRRSRRNGPRARSCWRGLPRDLSPRSHP